MEVGTQMLEANEGVMKTKTLKKVRCNPPHPGKGGSSWLRSS
jgi:hypothetical protein